MTLVSKFANANSVVVTGWTSPTSAYADDASYATAAPGKNSTISSDYGFPAFTTSDIPDGSVINSVTVEIQDKSSVTNSVNATIGVQLNNNGTLLGSEQTQGMSTSDQLLTHQVTTGISLTDLRTANLIKARVAGKRANSNTAITWSLDYVKLTVDYSPGAQSVTATAAVSTWVVLAAAVTLGAVTRSPAAAASTWSALDATRAASISRTAAAATSAWTVLDASASTGTPSQNVTASPAIASWTVLDATRSPGAVTRSPPSAVSTWAALDATRTAGAIAVSPSAASAAWTVPAAVATPGLATVQPSAAASSWTVRDAVRSSGPVAVAGAPAAASFTALDAAAQPGAVTRSPAPAASTWMVPDARVVGAGDPVTAAPAVATWTVLGATVAAGSVTVTPAPAAGGWVVLSPTVTLGGVVASPAAVVSTWTVRDATAGAPVVTPHDLTATPGATPRAGSGHTIASRAEAAPDAYPRATCAPALNGESMPGTIAHVRIGASNVISLSSLVDQLDAAATFTNVTCSVAITTRDGTPFMAPTPMAANQAPIRGPSHSHRRTRRSSSTTCIPRRSQRQ